MDPLKSISSAPNINLTKGSFFGYKTRIKVGNDFEGINYYNKLSGFVQKIFNKAVKVRVGDESFYVNAKSMAKFILRTNKKETPTTEIGKKIEGLAQELITKSEKIPDKTLDFFNLLNTSPQQTLTFEPPIKPASSSSSKTIEAATEGLSTATFTTPPADSANATQNADSKDSTEAPVKGSDKVMKVALSTTEKSEKAAKIIQRSFRVRKARRGLEKSELHATFKANEENYKSDPTYLEVLKKIDAKDSDSLKADLKKLKNNDLFLFAFRHILKNRDPEGRLIIDPGIKKAFEEHLIDTYKLQGDVFEDYHTFNVKGIAELVEYYKLVCPELAKCQVTQLFNKTKGWDPIKNGKGEVFFIADETSDTRTIGHVKGLYVNYDNKVAYYFNSLGGNEESVQHIRKALGDDFTIVTGTTQIQHDYHNCMIFATACMANIAKSRDTFAKRLETIAKSSESKAIFQKALIPEAIMLAQSMSLLKRYDAWFSLIKKFSIDSPTPHKTQTADSQQVDSNPFDTSTPRFSSPTADPDELKNLKSLFNENYLNPTQKNLEELKNLITSKRLTEEPKLILKELNELRDEVESNKSIISKLKKELIYTQDKLKKERQIIRFEKRLEDAQKKLDSFSKENQTIIEVESTLIKIDKLEKELEEAISFRDVWLKILHEDRDLLNKASNQVEKLRRIDGAIQLDEASGTEKNFLMERMRLYTLLNIAINRSFPNARMPLRNRLLSPQKKPKELS